MIAGHAFCACISFKYQELGVVQHLYPQQRFRIDDEAFIVFAICCRGGTCELLKEDGSSLYLSVRRRITITSHICICIFDPHEGMYFLSVRSLLGFPELIRFYNITSTIQQENFSLQISKYVHCCNCKFAIGEAEVKGIKSAGSNFRMSRQGGYMTLD